MLCRKTIGYFVKDGSGRIQKTKLYRLLLAVPDVTRGTGLP
jgi:hypothetical protein